MNPKTLDLKTVCEYHTGESSSTLAGINPAKAMELTEILFEKAASVRAKIVLPEGEDPRIIEAAAAVTGRKAAEIILLGDESRIKDKAAAAGADLSGMLIRPVSERGVEEYARIYTELQRKRGRECGLPQALEIMGHPVYFAAMMVREREADGMVAGCVNYSSTVMRAAYRIVGLQEGASLFSSFLVLAGAGRDYGENGTLVLADPSVNPEPDAEKLASIAISTASSAKKLFGWEPRVALLSYSTMGSSSHDSPEKVRKALAIARRLDRDLKIDGEIQADAALVPEVARMKGAGDLVAGKANILVFPNLDSGNISYKLLQRLAGVKCFGPILQGFSRPVNDLSRGASAEDIAGVICITSIQAGTG